MIPYPSSSPSGAPNVTYIESPADRTATIVGGTAIGALGIGGLFVAAQYLKPPKKEKKREKEKTEGNDKEEEQEQDETTVGIRLGEGLSYVCVATSELEEIVELLTAFRKRFHVLAATPLRRIE